MYCAVRAVDLHCPGARVAAVVERILHLGAGDDGHFGRAAGVACPLRVKKGQRVAASELPPKSSIVWLLVLAGYEIGETLLQRWRRHVDE